MECFPIMFIGFLLLDLIIISTLHNAVGRPSLVSASAEKSDQEDEHYRAQGDAKGNLEPAIALADAATRMASAVGAALLFRYPIPLAISRQYGLA